MNKEEKEREFFSLYKKLLDRFIKGDDIDLEQLRTLTKKKVKLISLSLAWKRFLILMKPYLELH